MEKNSETLTTNPSDSTAHAGPEEAALIATQTERIRLKEESNKLDRRLKRLLKRYEQLQRNRQIMFKLDGKFVIPGPLTERGYTLQWCKEDGTPINRRHFYITADKLSQAMGDLEFERFVNEAHPDVSAYDESTMEPESEEALSAYEIKLQQKNELN